MRKRPWVLASFVVLSMATTVHAQFPDLIYYKFDEGTGVGGTTANLASPGVGSMNAVVTGHTLAPTGGQFNGGLVGATPGASTNFVNTGWNTAFGMGSWTISLWADVSTLVTSTLYYVMGDSTAASFRAFYNGAAGVGNLMLRGGFTDIILPGAGTAPHTVTFVYDASVPEMRGYIDGVLTATVPQAALNINGTTPFRVGGYNSGNWTNGALLDEFRIWGRALTPAEVAATSNVSLFDSNILALSQSGPGVGDLTVSLTAISPNAIDGWTLLSQDVTAPTGSGWILGLTPTAVTWEILGFPYYPGNPFRFRTTDVGVFPNTPYMVGAGAVSGLNGLTFDFACLLLGSTGQYVGKSNLVRFQFQ